MKLMLTLTVVAFLSVATLALAATGTWHRDSAYDTGNAAVAPCPMDKGNPCPAAAPGKPCPMAQGKPCPMEAPATPCPMSK